MAGPREERPYRLDETDRSARAGTLKSTNIDDFGVSYFEILRFLGALSEPGGRK